MVTVWCNALYNHRRYRESTRAPPVRSGFDAHEHITRRGVVRVGVHAERHVCCNGHCAFYRRIMASQWVRYQLCNKAILNKTA